MSDHDDTRGGPPGEFMFIVVIVLGFLIWEGAGPAAHAVGRELFDGVPLIDLPFKLIGWIFDQSVGDILRRLKEGGP